MRAVGFLVAQGASIIPITLRLDAIRQLMCPETMEGFKFLPMGVELGMREVRGVVFLFLARRALRFFEHLARRDGRLTLRGREKMSPLSSRCGVGRRILKVGAWLGWQIESNWTDPFLFAVYSVVKPVAGALILVFMYLVVVRGGLGNPLFPYICVRNVFYIYVGAVLMGISWAVIGDREHYRGPWS